MPPDRSGCLTNCNLMALLSLPQADLSTSSHPAIQPSSHPAIQASRHPGIQASRLTLIEQATSPCSASRANG